MYAFVWSSIIGPWYNLSRNFSIEVSGQMLRIQPLLCKSVYCSQKVDKALQRCTRIFAIRFGSGERDDFNSRRLHVKGWVIEIVILWDACLSRLSQWLDRQEAADQRGTLRPWPNQRDHDQKAIDRWEPITRAEILPYSLTRAASGKIFWVLPYYITYKEFDGECVSTPDFTPTYIF